MLCGQGGYAKVDVGGTEREAYAAVLRHAALGDVETRDELDPRDDRLLDRLGYDQLLAHDAIHAHANLQILLFGMEVDVGRVGRDAHGDDLIDQPDHRRVDVAFGRLQQTTGEDLLDGLVNALAARVVSLDGLD